MGTRIFAAGANTIHFLWTGIWTTMKECSVLWATEPWMHLLNLKHSPFLWCLLPFLIHPAHRCLNSFALCAIPLKAAFHDISVTNSYSDELDSFSYLQLLTRFCTGISARNLHTVSERMMSCSDKTLTLKWQAVLAKVTQIVFKRIPNDNAMNSASFLECNLAIQNNHCTCV